MQRIRELRQEMGLSQVKLAVQADMDPATLNRLEQGKGNPNLRTLQRVANALGVEVADMLGKAPAPPSQERLFNNGVLQIERRYSESGLGAAEDFYERALEPVAVSMRALVETFEPILDELHEPPMLQEYPRVRPLFEAAAQINKSLVESGSLHAANELLAESERGGPDARELGQKVRTFHTSLFDLNELATRAREWARRVPEIAGIREHGLGDEDRERELRQLLSDATAPQTPEQPEAESR